MKNFFFPIAVFILIQTNLFAQVGIGTTTPQTMLDVNSKAENTTVATFRSAAGSAAVSVTNGRIISSFGTDGTVGIIGANGDFKIRTAGSDRMSFINQTGNIGVGTTAPFSLFANTNTNLFGSDGVGLGYQSLGWSMSGIGYTQVIYNQSDLLYSNGLAVKIVGTGNQKILDLSTGSIADQSGTSRMIVLGNGNVGINVPLPQQRLDVNGTIKTSDIMVDNLAADKDFVVGSTDGKLKHRTGFGGLAMTYIICITGNFPNTESSFNESIIGEVKLYAGRRFPSNWLPCDGRILNINENQALYSLIGTSYGGNGQSTFALPDLRERAPVGFKSNSNWNDNGVQN